MDPSTADSQPTRELPDQTREAIDQTKHGIEEQARERKNAFAQELQSVAQALRITAEQLGNEQKRTLSGYASRAAEAVESFGDQVQETSVRELLSKVERACRDNPMIAGGVSMLIGLAGSRLLHGADQTTPPETQQETQQETQSEEGGI